MSHENEQVDYLSTIKEKIERIGTPLSIWEEQGLISIHRGIITGLNEAFIIDEETKNKIIEQAQANKSNSVIDKSEEIIKPIITNKDVEPWHTSFKNKYLITTFPALNLDINDYPAVERHLRQFYKQLKQTGETGSRKKTDYRWFETQNSVAYYEEFTKDKIITQGTSFVCDTDEYYTNYNCSIITGEQNLRYLTGVLNSSLFKFILKKDLLNLNKNNIDNKNLFIYMPIPLINQENNDQIHNLANIIGHNTRTITAFHKEIDKVINQQYYNNDTVYTTNEIIIRNNALINFINEMVIMDDERERSLAEETAKLNINEILDRVGITYDETYDIFSYCIIASTLQMTANMLDVNYDNNEIKDRINTIIYFANNINYKIFNGINRSNYDNEFEMVTSILQSMSNLMTQMTNSTNEENKDNNIEECDNDDAKNELKEKYKTYANRAKEFQNLANIFTSKDEDALKNFEAPNLEMFINSLINQRNNINKTKNILLETIKEQIQLNTDHWVFELYKLTEEEREYIKTEANKNNAWSY